jgi:hypothetical protein
VSSLILFDAEAKAGDTWGVIRMSQGKGQKLDRRDTEERRAVFKEALNLRERVVQAKKMRG